MNERVTIAVMLAAVAAHADPGTSPYVVAYQPPPVEESAAHRGFTFEAALGGGTTSYDAAAQALSFGIGGWITHDVSLAFRVSYVGTMAFVGASVQYDVTPRWWLGGGAGGLNMRTMDAAGGTTTRATGPGGFGRIGYDVAVGEPHTLYVAAELQAGSVASDTAVVGAIALGYQLH
jgi:hypothetical protein